MVSGYCMAYVMNDTTKMHHTPCSRQTCGPTKTHSPKLHACQCSPMLEYIISQSIPVQTTIL